MQPDKADKAVKKREKQLEFKDRHIDKISKFFMRKNWSANRLSYFALLLTIIMAVCLSLGFLHELFLAWIPCTLLLLSGGFDLLDGEIARRTNTASDAGAFLDSTLDRISDTVIISSFILSGLIHHWLGFILIFLIIMVSYSRTRAESLGIDMKGVGKMERAERFFFLFFLLVIEFFVYFFTRISVFFWGIIVFTILLLQTFIQRISFAFKNLKNNEKKL